MGRGGKLFTRSLVSFAGGRWTKAKNTTPGACRTKTKFKFCGVRVRILCEISRGTFEISHKIRTLLTRPAMNINVNKIDI